MADPSATNSDSPLRRRNILVTGATGKQGTAFIRALLQAPLSSSAPPKTTPNPDEPPFHIYALTRKPNSPSAVALLNAHNPDSLTLVQGDLDSADSINGIFTDLSSPSKNDASGGGGGGIYGVFAVLAYPGLGASADGEERQGRLLAGTAARFGVKVFVYSSVSRAGPKYELEMKLSGKAKREIEGCVKELDAGWTIIRPGFFMENFDNFIGSIGVSVMRGGLKEDTEIGLIAADDIGGVAAGVFRAPEKYNHKILTAIGEYSTMSQIEESYTRATGNTIPGIAQPLAWFITKTNASTQALIFDLERHNHARKSGEYPELDEEIQLANEAFKMRSYYEWVKDGKEEEKAAKAGWNGLSVSKLLTGRF